MSDGISRSTALIIGTRDDILCSASGPHSNGKFSAWIHMPNQRPLLSTKPIFDSWEAAMMYIKELREEMKELAPEITNNVVSILSGQSTKGNNNE